MSELRVIPATFKKNFKSEDLQMSLTESINYGDVRKSLSPSYIMKHFSIQDIDTDIPENWKGVALTFPAATLVFDLAGSSVSIRERGAKDYVIQNQEIFSELTQIIYSQEGIIEKFPGDGISAHFPLFIEESIDLPITRAFVSMCKIINFLEQEQSMRRNQFRFTLTYGKDTIITKFGGEKHQELISIGHAVNLAHKLEKNVKNKGCFIGIDEICYPYCSDSIKLRVEEYNLESNLRRIVTTEEKWYGVKY